MSRTMAYNLGRTTEKHEQNDYEYVVEFHGSKGWEIYRFYSTLESANEAFIRELKNETDITVVWRLVQLTREEMSRYVFENHPANL